MLPQIFSNINSLIKSLHFYDHVIKHSLPDSLLPSFQTFQALCLSLMFVLRSDGSMWWAVQFQANHLLAVVKGPESGDPGGCWSFWCCPHMAVLTAVSLSSSCCIGTQMIPSPCIMCGSCVSTDSLQLSLVLWSAVFCLFCNPVCRKSM